MKKILYVEDEPFLGKIVHETLLKNGFAVERVSDGTRVIQAFKTYQPDVCVLDIMLPHIDGYTLCRQIRTLTPTLPIIFVTAKTETKDLVKGFEAGGTDYIRKPFSIEELIVRINNQLNLHPHGNDTEEKVPEKNIGRYTYYPLRYELVTPSRTLRLSQREQEILNVFMTSVNKTVNRKDLLKTVWGDDSFFNSRTLDVYIRKLRAYFSEDPNIEIVTLKGKGYLFLVKNQEEKTG